MMKSVAIHTIIYLVAAMALGSCLKDDIPYPHIQANFRNIEADGDFDFPRNGKYI